MVNAIDGQRYRPTSVPKLEIRAFSDEFLDGAAALRQTRHTRRVVP
jgi:hypothetical protein